MERIEMNQEERDWLDWLKRAKDGVVTQRMAAEKMGVTERWVRALLVKMKTTGDAVVLHGLRGRESNRRIEEGIKEQAMKILKLPDWHDFGPTFASQQLSKRHRIGVSKETLRKWMIADGLWESKTGQGFGDSPVEGATQPLWRSGAVGHLHSRLAGRARRTRSLSGAYD